MSTLITGNTYAVKDQIKALGGRWDPDAKGWRVPAAKAAEAQRLVGGAPRQTYGLSGGNYRRARKCKTGGNCSSFGSGRSCGAADCDGY